MRGLGGRCEGARGRWAWVLLVLVATVSADTVVPAVAQEATAPRVSAVEKRRKE